MWISVLGSGSGGNCTLAASDRTCVLVDLGFGPRSLARRLKEAGLEKRRIDAILVTHGHSDHTKGVVDFAQKNRVTVFMNEGTRDEVPELRQMERWESFEAFEPFRIGDLTFEAFPVSHDAAQPVGFRLTANGVRGALATDLGEIDATVSAKLGGCDWLVLESNHDEELLKLGPYPWSLKQRVMGRSGHLSNAAAADFLAHDFDGGASHILLAHLSRKNNHPDVALARARQALLQRPRTLFESCRVHLTDQTKPSIVLDL